MIGNLTQETLDSTWKQSMAEQYEENGLFGDINFYDRAKPVDHNYANKLGEKIARDNYREIFRKEREMVKNQLELDMEIILSEMVEGSHRDYMSNYIITEDDIDEAMGEMLEQVAHV